MIQDGTVVKITDNAGGKVGKVFKVPGGAHRRYAGIGDTVIISVKVAEPRKGVKKKDVHHAVVVRTRAAHRRKDGSYIRFDDNAVVILEKARKIQKQVVSSVLFHVSLQNVDIRKSFLLHKRYYNFLYMKIKKETM